MSTSEVTSRRPVIRVEGLTQHYGIRPVLKKVSFEVMPGELIALIGPNGMGKSTLLGAMGGVLSPQKGYVEINGKRRRASCDEELAIRKETVYLPDHVWLPAMRTGREYLLAVGRIYDIEEERLMKHVEGLLELFELVEKAEAPISSYSTGQQKKIAVCGALVTEAPVMLLDEPFSGGLDPSALLALKRVMKHLADRDDVTVVMATPVPEIVEEIAHRVLILRQGEVVAYDTPDGLRTLTGCTGPLQDVFEKLLHPKTIENIDKYFKDRAS
ncbi:MAG: ABC transporter ATP-binding protein [bacterium]